MKISLLPLLLLLLLGTTLNAQKAELVLPAAHAQPVTAINFSPDGKLLLTVVDDEPLRIWDVASKRLYKALPVPALDISFTSDSRLAIMACGRAIIIVDLQKMEVIKRIDVPNGIMCSRVAVSPVTQKVYAAAYAARNAYIYQLDVAAGALTQLSNIPQESLNTDWDCMDFSADGKKMLVATHEFGSVVFNLNPFGEEKRYNPATKVMGMAPDGSLLALSEGYNGNSEGGTYSILDAKTGAVKEKYDIAAGDQWMITVAGRHHFVGSGHNTIIHDRGDVWLLDAATKRVSVLYHNPDKYGAEYKKIALSPDGKLLAVGQKSPLLLSYSNGTAKPAGNFGSPMMWMWNLAASPAKNDLAVCDIGNYAKTLQLNSAGFGLQTYKAPRTGGPLALSPDGKSFMVGDDNQQGWQYQIGFPNQTPRTLDLHTGYQMEDATYSPDGKYLACNQVEAVTVVEANTPNPGRRVFTTPANGKYSLPIGRNSLAFSPDSKRIVFLQIKQDPKRPDEYVSESHVICMDVTTRAVVWDKVMGASGFQFAPDGRKIIAYDESKAENQAARVLEINAQTGDVLQTWNLGSKSQSVWAYAFTVSPDGKTILNGNSDNQLDVYNVATRSLVASIKGHDLSFRRIKFLHNPRYVASIGYDNTIRYYDLQTRAQLAQMVLFNGSSDWAVITEDGRFDASDGALKMMYYTKGREFIPLESLYERYFTPKLLQSLLGGEKLEPVPVDVEVIKLPPTVKIKFDRTKSRNLSVDDDVETVESSATTITLTLEVECKESAIAEIRLFHNGKLVDAGTRNLVVEDDTPAPSGGDRQTRTYTINLLAGNNTFKAIALNAQRTESKPAELIVRFKPATPAPSGPTSSGVTLHLMVIGINAYKNPKYNLNYAQADATGFKTALNKNCGKIVKTCKEHYLSDAQAVKANILAEFEKVVAEAKPEDIFVLYYAGHGVMTETDKQFFLVPHDVIQLYGNDGALAQKGLSAGELKAFAQKIKAQKQLFILDACQSSGALETIAARGAAEEKAIAQLARATGTHWLTAAGSQQFASEFAQLGHGVFTYALLDGLGGKADVNGDGQITVKELDSYLQDVVPVLTEKHKGSPQFPASYGFGNDFPVGVK
jgi:WD40 repeat protein